MKGNLNMIKFSFTSRFTPLISRLSHKWSSSFSPKNTDSEILESKIISHLYPVSSELSEGLFDMTSSSLRKKVSGNTPLTPTNIFHMSLQVIGPQSKLQSQSLSFLSESALSQLRSSSLSPADHALLLVSAALLSRRSSSALQPAILSGLAASRDTVSTLRYLYVAGLVRLRLPASVWRGVQERLADRAAGLSEADLVALSSASFRCSAAISSGRLQQRLLAAARRLSDSADPHTGSLVALLKALRLAHVPCAPLLASLRRLVARRGAGLPLPAAAHLAACWCAPPVRDASLLAALEVTLRRRLEALLERPPGGGGVPPGGSTRQPGGSTGQPGGSIGPSGGSAVPDGRPKDVARLLHAFSQLGHAPDGRTLAVTERWMSGWSLRQPLPLVDALLSLAILGRYPQPLLEMALTEQVAQRLAAAGRSRQLSRLALLHLAVSLETPLRPPPLDRLLAPPALPAPCLQRELRRRPRLAPLLERLRRQQPAARATLGYPVPHLNSASVLLSWPDGRRAAVELLDGDALLVRAADVTPAGDVTGFGGDTGAGDVTGFGDVIGAGDVTGFGDATEQGDGTEHRDVKGHGAVTELGDVTGLDAVRGRDDVSNVGGVTGRDDVSNIGDVAGPESAVGLVRLKARLAEKLGYTVWWELRP